MLTLYHLLIYMSYLYLDPDYFSNYISNYFLKKLCITYIFSDVSLVTNISFQSDGQVCLKRLEQPSPCIRSRVDFLDNWPLIFFLSPLFVSPYLFQQLCSREINGPPSCCYCTCHLSDTFARGCARCCLNKRARVCCVCMCVFAFVSLERVILWRVGSRRADKLFAKTNN